MIKGNIKYDIVALGELLIDFTPESSSSEGGDILFKMNPGGAPANVLTVMAKLGKRAAFIGKVGDDQFGTYLKDTLCRFNIDTKGMIFSPDVNTTLAFVHLNKYGDRTFSFFRKPGADMMLNEKEVQLDIINDAKIFHFGSISMTHEPSRSATFKALKYARENGVIVSYDPNLRIPLWNDLNYAKETILECLGYVDILKISSEELLFLTGIEDPIKGVEYLYSKYSIKVIFITLGADGCIYKMGDLIGCVPGYTVKTVDTTGAGDAFLGGVLYKILEKDEGIDTFTAEDAEEIVRFGNIVGALTTTKKGAIPAIPSKADIDNFIKDLKGGFSYGQQ